MRKTRALEAQSVAWLGSWLLDLTVLSQAHGPTFPSLNFPICKMGITDPHHTVDMRIKSVNIREMKSISMVIFYLAERVDLKRLPKAIKHHVFPKGRIYLSSLLYTTTESQHGNLETEMGDSLPLCSRDFLAWFWALLYLSTPMCRSIQNGQVVPAFLPSVYPHPSYNEGRALQGRCRVGAETKQKKGRAQKERPRCSA